MWNIDVMYLRWDIYCLFVPWAFLVRLIKGWINVRMTQCFNFKENCIPIWLFNSKIIQFKIQRYIVSPKFESVQGGLTNMCQRLWDDSSRLIVPINLDPQILYFEDTGYYKKSKGNLENNQWYHKTITS